MSIHRNVSSWERCVVRSLLAVCLLSLVGGAGSYLAAQSRNPQLTGVVTDPSGAAVPDAGVSITNEATGVQIPTKTNGAGVYSVVNLIVGTYQVEFSAPGFKTLVRSGFPLQVGERGRLDARLEIGEIAEQVTVTVEALALKTESADVSQIVTAREMQYMPNLARSTVELLNLSALTKSTGQTGYHQWVQFGGSDHTMTGFYFNGAGAMDPGGSQVVSATNREFVEEFRMVANSFSAEFKGGKVFAVSTKSGGNDFHGGGNFLIMDDNLNATPWGATSVLPFRETEWGLQLGGPIVKNKTHFFVGFQRTRFDQNFPVFLTIPTPAQIGGDFSQTLNADGGLIQIYDPATTRPDPSDPTSLIRDPFPGNSIPSSRFDSVAVNMLGFYPGPTQPGTVTGGRNFDSQRPKDKTVPQWNYRIDHQWNEKHKTYGVYATTNPVELLGSVYGTPGVSDGGSYFIDVFKRDISVMHTFVPSPVWVLETSFAMNRILWAAGDEGWGQGFPQRLGLTGVGNADIFPQVSISGFSGLKHAPWSDVRQDPIAAENVAQRFAHYRGKHSFKFGVEATRSRQAFINDGQTRLSFNPQATALPFVAGTGHSVASMLLGEALSGSLSKTEFTRTMNAYYAYVEDSWKARDNLTINLGLRYEMGRPPFIRDPGTGDISLSSFDGNQINPVSGTPGIITYAGVDFGEGALETQQIFGPRLGIAWQPWGAGSNTVIRAGGGIFAGGATGQGSFVHRLGLGQTANGAWSSPDGGVSPAFLLKDGFPPLATGQVGRELPGPGFGAVEVGEAPRLSVGYANIDDYSQPYLMQWDFTIQHALPRDITVEAAYLANQTRHYTFSAQNNQLLPAAFGPGNAQIRRPFPQYGNVLNFHSTGFSSSYHALQLKATKRSSTGLTFQSDYVFSKNRDNFRPWNRYDLQSAWAMAEPQHRSVTYVIYALPWGRGQRWLNSGAASNVLGGWVVSNIMKLQSGNYLDAAFSSNTSNAFLQGNQGVNLIGGDPNLSKSSRTTDRYFNTDAFGPPDAFTLGNAGRSIILGPSSFGFNFAIHKQFDITEQVRAQFRTEAANLFNHPNLNNPGTSFGAPSFGVVSGKSGFRQILMGVKVLF